MTLFVWLLSLCVSAVMARRLTRPESRLRILDHPNHRSLHQLPVPRTGGVALLAGILVGLLYAAYALRTPEFYPVLVAALLLAAGTGFLDDLRDLRARYRLLIQLLAGSLLFFAGLGIDTLALPGWHLAIPAWISLLLTLLFVVWMINLYNFMDGMDGLAGSMALVGFGTLATIGWLAQEPVFMLVNGAIALAALGFLWMNLPPAKLFLGDTGSYTLGFLAAAMLLWGAHQTLLPLWVGVLIFSPFIADATFTLGLRLLRGERVWEAHREHAYQRAVQSGLSKQRVLLFAVILMSGCSGVALASIDISLMGQWIILVCVTFFYLMLFWSLRKRGYNRARD